MNAGLNGYVFTISFVEFKQTIQLKCKLSIQTKRFETNKQTQIKKKKKNQNE